jgi:hypothetical protein
MVILRRRFTKSVVTEMKIKLVIVALAALFGALEISRADLAVSEFTIHPGQTKQVIKGIGFEIQSDSIGSGNHGLPEEPIGVPHDLIPPERERLADEMLKGFRYCRLAGGLYWRGLDAEKKFLRPRWPEQLTELRALLDAAGVEGVSFEYWSPAPFWKGSQSYVGAREGDPRNRLRCFAPGFAEDAIYHGDTNRFLADFAAAVVADIQTLKAAGIKTSMFGLQNEPDVNHSIYSSCEYPGSRTYVAAFTAVANAVRKHDTNTLIFADTFNYFPKLIGGGMSDPKVAALVDAYVVHIVGSSSETPRKIHADIATKLPPRPWFQNEYEYLTGGATPDRCLNTVQHIMNSFQLAENPTWFWIHALKPLKNAEASGYSLGFWKSLIEKPNLNSAEQFRRWPEGPEFTQLPALLKQMEMISVKRAADGKPAIAYNFLVNQPVTIFLLAADGSKLDAAWTKTDLKATWDGGADTIFTRKFPAGKVEVPAPGGKAVAHSVFVEPTNPPSFKAQIGLNLPMQIRSETLALERKAAAVAPGHWIFNPYNWNAVGSFVRHMPWDCVALAMDEKNYDANARVLAFKKPDGKITVVVSNRTPKPHTFDIATGLDAAAWRGFRYTPDEAGRATMGISIGTQTGARLHPELPPLSWEFWEQQ